MHAAALRGRRVQAAEARVAMRLAAHPRDYAKELGKGDEESVSQAVADEEDRFSRPPLAQRAREHGRGRKLRLPLSQRITVVVVRARPPAVRSRLALLAVMVVVARAIHPARHAALARIDHVLLVCHGPPLAAAMREAPRGCRLL